MPISATSLTAPQPAAPVATTPPDAPTPAGPFERLLAQARGARDPSRTRHAPDEPAADSAPPGSAAPPDLIAWMAPHLATTTPAGAPTGAGTPRARAWAAGPATGTATGDAPKPSARRADAPTLADGAEALAKATLVPDVLPDAPVAGAQPRVDARAARSVAGAGVASDAAARRDGGFADDTDAAPVAATPASGRGTPDAAAATDAAPRPPHDDPAPGSDDAPTPSAPAPLAAAAPRTAVAAAAAALPTPTLSPPVGDAAWGAALAQHMLRMNASGHHEARLNLHPAELGPLQVTLSISDQHAQALFTTAHDSVRRALEAALPQLRATLAAQGIALGEASVGTQSQPGRDQTGGFADPSPAPPGPRSERSADASPAESRAAPSARAPRSGGLDTFA